MFAGRVEMVSSSFAFGWCEASDDQPVFVYAALGGETLGVSEANLFRPDLEKRKSAGRPEARAFLIVFRQSIGPDKLDGLTVKIVGENSSLPHAVSRQSNREPMLQVFMLGSPRSGTSQLAKTLSDQLALPWLGEGHGAPSFAEAARALNGDAQAQGGLARFLARQKLGHLAVEAAQRAYYFAHSSASFLDKTPGLAMIRAAPFITQCFPQAKFIYVVRNGISNVLSRVTKFGGRFDAHCADWVAANKNWEQVRSQLPHFLEVRQESMAEEPAPTALRIAAYLQAPGTADAIATSLSKGALERTGAGRGKAFLDQTGWTSKQIDTFVDLCGPTMEQLGYPLRRAVIA